MAVARAFRQWFPSFPINGAKAHKQKVSLWLLMTHSLKATLETLATV
jgi:hypothetical protein